MSSQIKRWKCNVCGKIMEGTNPPEKCPVCGVGADNFTMLEDEIIEFKSDKNERIIIIGGGTSAVAAAESIRKRNDSCSITMISDEKILPYNRPMLTKNLFEDFSRIDISIKPRTWYDEQKINLLIGESAAKILPEEKKVLLAGGDILQYDKLILATGASSFIPPIPGHDKEGVFVIRKMDDVLKIQEMAHSAENAAVIGGGVLGLEAAWELHRAGKNTVVLELGNSLMGRQLDDAGADILLKSAESVGIKCLTGVKIDKIAGDSAAAGVALEDGRIIDAQIIIISAGVRANTSLAGDAGIKAERNIPVNAFMETTCESIYACGDCAEFDGINYAIIPQAEGQGIIAGAVAAGDRSTNYKHETPAVYFDGFNTNVFAIGDNGKNPDTNYDVIDESQGNNYKKLYFVNGEFKGGLLIGNIDDAERLKEAYRESLSMEKMLK